MVYLLFEKTKSGIYQTRSGSIIPHGFETVNGLRKITSRSKLDTVKKLPEFTEVKCSTSREHEQSVLNELKNI